MSQFTAKTSYQISLQKELLGDNQKKNLGSKSEIILEQSTNLTKNNFF